MKKICLSIDQMRQLKELGIETKDASMCWVRDPEGKYTPSIHDEYCYELSFMAPVPAFTLQDMIEMMPTITHHDGWLLKDEHGEYKVSYKKSMDSAIIGTHYWDNPLDAAFDMFVWLAKHGYLKGGKNESD